MAATGEDAIVEIGGGEDDFLALEQGSLRRQFVRRVFNTVASNFLLLFTCLLLLNVMANFQITKSNSERSIAFAPVPLLKIGAYTVATYAFLVIAAKYAPFDQTRCGVLCPLFFQLVLWTFLYLAILSLTNWLPDVTISLVTIINIFAPQSILCHVTFIELQCLLGGRAVETPTLAPQEAATDQMILLMMHFCLMMGTSFFAWQTS